MTFRAREAVSRFVLRNSVAPQYKVAKQLCADGTFGRRGIACRKIECYAIKSRISSQVSVLANCSSPARTACVNSRLRACKLRIFSSTVPYTELSASRPRPPQPCSGLSAWRDRAPGRHDATKHWRYRFAPLNRQCRWRW